jgi:uncharacterized protein (TIGR02001 family)
MQGRARRHAGARWAVSLLAVLVMHAGRGADFQGSLGASSDNVFRGVSLSDQQPSLFADVHASGTQWFGGVAADSVRLSPHERTSAQVIGYLGYQYPLEDGFRSAWSVRHYDYVSAFRNRYDYDELDATLSWQDRLFAHLIASPDTYEVGEYRRHGRGAAFAAELSGRQPLPYGLAAQLGVGYYDVRQEVGAGYAYWSAALSKQWDQWSFTVSYIGTDGTAQRLFGTLADQRVVGSVVWTF